MNVCRQKGPLLRAFFMSLLLALPSAEAQEAAVSGGLVAGLAMADGGSAYYGIPYAAPPLGALRWRAPQPVRPWEGVRPAQAFGPACAQKAAWIKEVKSEDCLYLNIWAPPRTEGASLPVMVWIHGGGYDGGSGAQPQFNGAKLARRGAIVVTFNYRLGIFGFFAHPQLTAESPVGAAGNQGILDQVAALQWVRRNIAAFGGDPQRVTIMGESAGGASVEVLLASPQARGLFQRAISQSGTGAMPLDALERRDYGKRAAEARGQAFAQRAGAPGLAALRRLDSAALQQYEWSPGTTLDGYALRTDLSSVYRARHQHDVPLLLGWNAEEGRDLAPDILGTRDFTAARHRDLAAELLGRAPTAALLAAYPGNTDAQAAASILRLATDWYGWRMTRWGTLQARYGRAPAYIYYFAHQPAAPLKPCTYGCGAGHGAEIRYMFDNLDQDRRPWSQADRQVAAQMAEAWVNFARSGDPNGNGVPAWLRYNGANASILRIGRSEEPLPDFGVFAR